MQSFCYQSVCCLFSSSDITANYTHNNLPLKEISVHSAQNCGIFIYTKDTFFCHAVRLAFSHQKLTAERIQITTGPPGINNKTTHEKD